MLQIEGWVRNGLTDEQIAKNMGVARATLVEWKKRFSEISDALKKGREVVDIEVENALLKKAKGYEYTEVTRKRIVEPNPQTGELEEKFVVTQKVTKEVVPDTRAIIFWLKNRKPDEWRDRKDVAHSGEIGNPMINLSEKELRKLANLSEEN